MFDPEVFRKYSGHINISMFLHLKCVIPSNIPFVIQRDVLVCEQSDRRHDSPQTYITAVGRCFPWRIQTPNAFVRRHYDFRWAVNKSTPRIDQLAKANKNLIRFSGGLSLSF